MENGIGIGMNDCILRACMLTCMHESIDQFVDQEEEEELFINMWEHPIIAKVGSKLYTTEQREPVIYQLGVHT